MTQVSTRPPTFVIFTTNPDKLPDSYIRYLSNGLRDEFGITGIPVRIQLRKRENPYAEKSKKSS
jgi:GTP-binding protein